MTLEYLLLAMLLLGPGRGFGAAASAPVSFPIAALAAGPGPIAGVSGANVAEQYLFAQANAERTQRGLRPLRWDAALARAAEEQAREMASRQAISHQFPGEPELSERARQAGARFSVVAENVAEAPSAAEIQDEWMHSPGHRANLLDPRVDAMGAGVVERGGELYAAEDFDRQVDSLSLDEQEAAVAAVLRSVDNAIRVLPSSADARRTCTMDSGYAGGRQPWFVMRYTAADLTRLPAALTQKLATGKYHQAAVAACAAQETQNFSAYRIAVMLYP